MHDQDNIDVYIGEDHRRFPVVEQRSKGGLTVYQVFDILAGLHRRDPIVFESVSLEVALDSARRHERHSRPEVNA